MARKPRDIKVSVVYTEGYETRVTMGLINMYENLVRKNHPILNSIGRVKGGEPIAPETNGQQHPNYQQPGA